VHRESSGFSLANAVRSGQSRADAASGVRMIQNPPRTPAEQPILQVRDLVRAFGGIVAVNNFSLDVYPSSIHGLIGPNGAGKTTTFNVISGFYAPSSGRVIYRGEDISGRETCALAELGLIRTFQGTTLFHALSVLDNVRLGCHRSAKAGLASRVLGRDRASEQAADAKAHGILEFFGLRGSADVLASELPHGHQRALGMAVALAADPKLMLLDEPFTGMNFEETRRMGDLVRRVRDEQGVTIMLIEHDMQAVMGLCEIITVMNFGMRLAEGTPAEVRANPAVIEAYLGTAHVA
jgi:branched-chain amino acid transport system ATP-binding protein